jgi:hypothetical protein
MRNLTLMLVLTACCFSCKKDDLLIRYEPEYDPINFAQMAVGQKSYYIRLKGDGFRMTKPYKFEYLLDTLVAEVIAEANGTFTIRESLTPGSAAVKDQSIDTKEYTYKVNINKGILTLLPESSGTWQSRLFPKAKMTLPMAESQTKSIPFAGWMPDPTENAKEGFLNDFKVLDKSFARLNFIRDYDDMAFDGSGYFYVYSEKTGIVRAGQVSSWGFPGTAWDLLR